MSQAAEQHHPDGSPAEVLRAARACREAEMRATAQILEHALDWALMHEPVDPGSHGVSMWWEAGQALPLAGAGAPLVMEFAVAELAAALGLSTDAGRTLIGQALDLAFRRACQIFCVRDRSI